MSTALEFHIKSYIATSAIGAYELVKKSGSEVVVAGVGDTAIGVTMANAAAGTTVPVRLLNGYGTAFMKAGAGITANAAVRGIASGKVDDTTTGPILGYAEAAATADGDIIEVLLIGKGASAYVASADQGNVTPTASNPAAPSAYAAVVNMTDPVTKAEGEAVSAALATLRGEVATYETAISALVVDVAALVTQNTAIRAALITAGIIKGGA